MPTDRPVGPTTRAVRLSLELHSDGERIDGRLWDQHGNDWPFSSWLGLLGLLERLRLGASSPTNQPTQQELS